MDRRKLALLDALRIGALAGGETRLYRRGKLSGLFAQRTRANTELATEAVTDGLIEITRVETVGKTTVEWVRVTPKGLDYLLQSESPLQALEELRELIAINQEGMPRWVADINAQISAEVRRYAEEMERMRERLERLAERVTQAIDRLDADRAKTPETVAWANEALGYLEGRQRVGLGPRCALADLFVHLKEANSVLSIKDFHAGLKRMREAELIALLPSSGNGDVPGPEYALLDGAALYYYVTRASRACAA